MTILYRVETQYKKDTVKAFLDFKETLSNKRPSRQLAILGICTLILKFFAKTQTWSVVFAVVGVFFLALAVLRKPIAVQNLAKRNLLSQGQEIVRFSFGDREFLLEQGGEERKVQYGEISYIYEDQAFFFLGLNEDELHIIRKKDVQEGDIAGFKDFLSQKVKGIVKPLRLTWSQKWEILKQAWRER